MAFDELLFIPKLEADLIRDVANEIQRNFIAHRGQCYFIKFDQCEKQLSQLIWVKTFLDEAALEDFYFDTKMQRCLIYISYEVAGFFSLCAYGFHIWQDLEIHPHKIVSDSEYKAPGNLETDSMMSREQLARLFNQLTGVLSTRRTGTR